MPLSEDLWWPPAMLFMSMLECFLLAELERVKDAGQQFILTPEQQEEIKAFRRQEARAKKELKEVRKTLRREVDALEQRVKWSNILAMPLIVAAAGLLIAFFRHRRQSAR